MAGLMVDLRSLARALGGEVVGGQVSCPGPGHSPRDRSLSIKLSASSPDGFVTFSHADDDWRDCNDYVRRQLGIAPDNWKASRQLTEAAGRPIAPVRRDGALDERTAPAIALWHAGVDPRGTLAERYLASRSLELGEDVAGDVLRWHPGIGAMVGLFRDIKTDEPRAVSRTFLDSEARKVERRFLGPVGGCAIKLDADDTVLGGLYLAEGVETALAARQLGLRRHGRSGRKAPSAHSPCSAASKR